MNVRMRASYSDNWMPRCEETLLMTAATEPDHNRHRQSPAAQDTGGSAGRTQIAGTCKTAIPWTTRFVERGHNWRTTRHARICRCRCCRSRAEGLEQNRRELVHASNGSLRWREPADEPVSRQPTQNSRLFRDDVH